MEGEVTYWSIKEVNVMKVENFVIKGRKPLNVARLSGGYNWKPDYFIVKDNKMVKPTVYQRKKIYNYIKSGE